MIRWRIPGQDDPVLMKLVETQLVPLAKQARPHIQFDRKETQFRLEASRVLVAAGDRQPPFAFVSMWLGNQGNMAVDMLAVHPAYQGQGWGKHLMDAAENYGRRMGFRLIELFVDEPNVRAQRFYAKRGYAMTEYAAKQRCFRMSKPL